MAIYVLQPGPLTTVQDMGRFGYQASGMPVSGAMDRRAFRDANALAGNNGNEAVLEFTLLGGSFRFTASTVIALTGADMSPVLDGNPCPMYAAVPVKGGAVLSLSYAKSGCRTYLAVSGGIDVPPVMRSRSTCLKCRIGGFGGRALAAGDTVPTGKGASAGFSEPGGTTAPPVYPDHVTARVVEGPQAHCFTEDGLAAFYSAPYTVTTQSDRMGCRLDGPAVAAKESADILSDGTVFGSIQITSAGQPVILMADRQTTGGYAKIATVCTADLPVIAQCRPGNTVRFQKITLEEAQKLLIIDNETSCTRQLGYESS